MNSFSTQINLFVGFHYNFVCLLFFVYQSFSPNITSCKYLCINSLSSPVCFVQKLSGFVFLQEFLFCFVALLVQVASSGAWQFLTEKLKEIEASRQNQSPGNCSYCQVGMTLELVVESYYHAAEQGFFHHVVFPPTAKMDRSGTRLYKGC